MISQKRFDLVISLIQFFDITYSIKWYHKSILWHHIILSILWYHWIDFVVSQIRDLVISQNRGFIVKRHLILTDLQRKQQLEAMLLEERKQKQAEHMTAEKSWKTECVMVIYTHIYTHHGTDYYHFIKRAVTSESVPSDMCAQRRFRSACAFAQSDQNLHCAHFWLAKTEKILHADNKDSNQTARTRRLIWVFVGRTCQRYLFSRCGLNVSYFFGKINL